MEKYNTVVIGAGPAGLNCARVLGQNHKEVLVLERGMEVGPKICAGGLTHKCLNKLNPPGEILERQFKEISFFVGKMKAQISSDNYIVSTVDRKRLGRWMLSRVIETGILVLTNSKVTTIEDGWVEVNGEDKIGYDLLVGCDGSHSMVRKFLRLKTTKMLLSIHYMAPGRFDQLEIHLDPSLGERAATIFPHGEFAVISLTGSTKDTTGYMKMLNGWIESKNLNVGGRLEGYPINCDYRGHRFGRIYLAGDAAGLASNLTGEGIYQAVVSGEEVALEIINKKYKSLKISKLLAVKRSHQFIRHLLYNDGTRLTLYEILQLFSNQSLFHHLGLKIIG